MTDDLLQGQINRNRTEVDDGGQIGMSKEKKDAGHFLNIVLNAVVQDKTCFCSGVTTT